MSFYGYLLEASKFSQLDSEPTRIASKTLFSYRFNGNK